MYCTLISKPKPPLINFMATLLPVIVRKPIGNQVLLVLKINIMRVGMLQS